MQIQGFYDAGHVARRLGVSREDVIRWADKPTANFPIPIAELLQDKGRNRPIWSSSQLPALRTWLAARLNLSNPESHWALIDRRKEQPGGHQDQLAMFPLAHSEPDEGPDGLFAVPC
jgi:hypothetical protein